MYREYQERLVEKLNQTEITFEGSSPAEFEIGMNRLVALFTDVKRNGGRLFFAGNGGSAAIASHMTVDFMKNGGMKTYSLHDPAVLSCISNDYGYEFVFSKQIEFLAEEKDLFVAISSGGRSENMIHAIGAAKRKHVSVVTFTGFSANNPIRKMGDLNVYVPIEHYGIVESIHNLMLQQVADVLLERDGVSM